MASHRVAPQNVTVGIALGIASAVGFATGPILASLLYRNGHGWATVLAWRFAIAAAIAFGIAWLLPAYRRELRAMSWRRVLHVCGLGILFAGSAGTYYAAITFTPVSVAVLVINLAPALIAMLSVPFGATRLALRGWVALVVASAGALLAVADSPPGATNLAGIGLAFASALLYALWVIASEHAARSSARTGESTSSGVATPIMFAATAGGLLLLGLAIGQPMSPTAFTARDLGALVGFAVVGSILGIQASYAATARLGASRAGILLTVEPAIVVVLAVTILGEAVTPLQVVGAALVLIGIVMLGRGGAAEPERLPVATSADG